MQNNFFNSAAIVLVVAACTFATRVLPFALFWGNRQAPRIVKYLGLILPPAVIAILVIYCMKSADFTDMGAVLAQLLSVVTVVVLHLWKRNYLLSIGVGTVFYMFMVQVVFM